MTPCEKLGYKVGDKFTFVEGLPPAGIESATGFQCDQTITLHLDDGSAVPLFSGENTKYQHADGKPGAFVALGLLTKVED